VVLYYNADYSGLENRTVETVNTNQRGEFQFTERMPFKALDSREGDRYVVLALDAQHALGWAVIRGASPEKPLDIVLTEPRERAFHVTDAQGKPLANA